MFGSYKTVYSFSSPIQVDRRTSQGKLSESLVLSPCTVHSYILKRGIKEMKDEKWDMPSHPHEGLLFHFDWGTFY